MFNFVLITTCMHHIDWRAENWFSVKNDVKFQTQGKVFFERYTLSLTRRWFCCLKVLGSDASLDHSRVRHQFGVFLLDVHTSGECLAGSPWVCRHYLINRHQKVPAICSKVPGSKWSIPSRAPGFIQAWPRPIFVICKAFDLDRNTRKKAHDSWEFYLSGWQGLMQIHLKTDFWWP